MKWINQQQELDDAMARLSRVEVLAIDTEADSLHSYFDKVCLVQISAKDDDLLIDPLARINMQPLGPILAERGITKIFHGADYDLRILNRDFGFEVHNLVDTMICAQFLGIQQFGLGALLKKYFDLDTDKSHQRADWAMRPLPPDMLHYAITDTRYLIELAGKLRDELIAVGRWEWAQEEFERLEQIRFREPDQDAEAFRRLKGLGKLSRRALGAAATLYEWRDATARGLDRPAFKVLSNDTILEIARSLPTSLNELERLKGMPAVVVRRHGQEIVRRIAAVAAAPEESLPEKLAGKPWLRDPELDRKVERLKRIRDGVAGELGIDPGVIAPRHMLAAIAAAAPKSVDDLSTVTAMRQWQRNLLGEKFVAALQ
jgi:ribonuclease D